MKKIILTLVGFCFLFFDVLGQEIEWEKSLGGTTTDIASSIQRTNDGGYIVVGGAASNDGNVTGNHGDYDYWLVKTNGDGNLQWQKCIGGSQPDFAYSVKGTFDGGYIIAGYTESNDGDVTGIHGIYDDFWLVKTDSIGNLQWQKCFGGSNNDLASFAQQTSDGGYIMAGYAFSNNGDVTGNHGNNDYWIVKTDSIGNLLWQKCFGGTNEDKAYSAQQTSDGGYMVAGYTFSNDGDVSGNHGNEDYWLVKIDSIGNLQWQKCFGGSNKEVGYFIHQTLDGGYIVAGEASSNNGDVTGNHGTEDYWLVKIDSIGTLQWQKCFGGTSQDKANSIQQTSDDGYVVGGYSYSNDGDATGNDGCSYWLLKTDSIGNLQWQESYGGSWTDKAYSVLQAFDGGYVIAGQSISYDGDVTGNHGHVDYWLLKLTSKYNGITGKLFIDANSNGIKDTGELRVNNKQVTEINTGRFNFSNPNGEYLISVLDSGNFSVSSAPIDYYNATPLSHTAYFSNMQQSDSLNDFAFQPTGVFNDLCITITPLENFRPGFDANYMINYENVGTTTLSGTVIFFPDSEVTFVSSNPAATSVTADSVVWNVGTLTPFQTGSILVTVNVNAGTPIGTLINSNARIEPVAGDNYPGCNYAYWEVYTTGSYDPNAILVDRDTVLTTELTSPPYLNYIIYFQNTGNDTAFNARILNPIDDSKLQLNTFEFIASSHPLSIKYIPWERSMEFDFNNILIPDSNVNEPASHGFIRYKIKPLSTLVVGDSIKNNAAIYFDFNQPVMTDTAVTEIVLPTGAEEFDVQGLKFKVFPNPVRNELEIKNPQQGDKTKYEITISDITGRLNFQIQEAKLPAKLDVSKFAAGIYFLVINDRNTFFRTKVVKQ